MKSISRINVLAIMLVLLTGFSSQLFAQQQSDYQIVRNYQSEFNSLINDVKNLDSVDKADETLSRIDRLENEFNEHSTLINRYIFPEDFSAQVNNLRDFTNSSKGHLIKVAEQSSRINEMTNNISELTSEIDQYNRETDELRSQLQQMTRDRNANRAVAQNLRTELGNRDEFILGMVDSLFVAYDNLDLGSLSPAERQEFALRADKDNVITHVGSVVESNISFIDTHTQLSSADYLMLRANLVRFQDAWEKLGNKLADVYVASDERSNRVNEVNESINTWGNRLDDSVWRSLQATFRNRDIQLDTFESSSAFYSALNNYLDSALTRVEREGGSDDEKGRVANFADVWHNDVKVNWQEFLIDGRVLSYENVATIDRKLSDWSVGAEPRSSSWLIISGILGLIILVLVVLLVTRSNKETTVVADRKAKK